MPLVDYACFITKAFALIGESDVIHCEFFLSYSYVVEALSPSCRFSQSAQLIFWVSKKEKKKKTQQGFGND